MITPFIISGKISQSPNASTRVSVQSFPRKRVCPPPPGRKSRRRLYCTVLFTVQYKYSTIRLRLYSSKCVASLEQVFRIRNP